MARKYDENGEDGDGRKIRKHLFEGGDGDEGGEIERREEGRVARNLAESNFHY